MLQVVFERLEIVMQENLCSAASAMESCVKTDDIESACCLLWLAFRLEVPWVLKKIACMNLSARFVFSVFYVSQFKINK